MRVSVFDAHPVVHQGLTSLLPAQGFSVVSQALDGRDAVGVAREARAQIVITDIRLASVDGLQVLESITDSELQIPALVYSADSNPTYVARAIALGASDYVLKTNPLEDLFQALRRVVAKGEGRSADRPSGLFCEVWNKLQP